MSSGTGLQVVHYMTYSHLRFPRKQLLLLLCCGLFVFRAFSVEIPLEVRSFTPVGGGTVIGEGIQLYVSSFDDLAYNASNPSDVVVIEDITSLTVDENDEDDEDDDTYIFVSNYYGYNTVTGEEAESASLLMEVPVTYNTFYAGGAKGFYRKTGPWQQMTSDQSFMFEGATGSLAYHSLSKARDVEVEINGLMKALLSRCLVKRRQQSSPVIMLRLPDGVLRKGQILISRLSQRLSIVTTNTTPGF